MSRACGSLNVRAYADDVLFEELSPRQHFWFWARLRGVSVATAPSRVTSMLEETQLVEKADTPAFALSGGMRRRVSLGNAMLGKAQVLDAGLILSQRCVQPVLIQA
eukprot:SAG31_NODE_4639_length_3079_cov_1.638926_3_plen_106_part_00